MNLKGKRRTLFLLLAVVVLAGGYWLWQVLNAPEIIANTYHIQAVNEIGAGLQAVGFGPDGVVEAIESQDGRLIGVQFHPERMFDRTRPLFEDFVNRCRR